MAGLRHNDGSDVKHTSDNLSKAGSTVAQLEVFLTICES